LIGDAYDSLFKPLCAQAALRSADQQQIFAPFAFVSALAGVLLAIEELHTRLSTYITVPEQYSSPGVS
jgi:hypothetical protein